MVQNDILKTYYTYIKDVTQNRSSNFLKIMSFQLEYSIYTIFRTLHLGHSCLNFSKKKLIVLPITADIRENCVSKHTLMYKV